MNEPKTPQTKKNPEQVGLGLVMGAGVGIVFGILFDSISIGITFGAALGLVFGGVLSLKDKNKT